MRRRSLTHHPGSGHYATGADRWLVSYADYMTLAFALFVVLYALHANKTELQQPLLEGIEQTFVRLSGEAKPAKAANSMISDSDDSLAQGTGNPLTAEEISLAHLKAELALKLGPLLEKNKLALEQEGDWLTLSFDGGLIFASGSALLSSNAQIILTAVLPALTEVNHFIQVRGFADSLAISNELYASNWQLSAERARAVLEWLQNKGIASPRLSLMAYGEHTPPANMPTQLTAEASVGEADSNEALSKADKVNSGAGSKGRRAQDRRVEISIAKATWQAPTPLPSQPFTKQQSSDLRVYDLPNGGIRIGTRGKQDEVGQ